MKIVIEHNGKQYNFQYGYEAYIFDCAMSNDFDKTHTDDELKEFICCVADCYLKDCNQTPLGYLTDFMAIHWNMLKRLRLNIRLLKRKCFNAMVTMTTSQVKKFSTLFIKSGYHMPTDS